MAKFWPRRLALCPVPRWSPAWAMKSDTTLADLGRWTTGPPPRPPPLAGPCCGSGSCPAVSSRQSATAQAASSAWRGRVRIGAAQTTSIPRTALYQCPIPQLLLQRQRQQLPMTSACFGPSPSAFAERGFCRLVRTPSGQPGAIASTR